MEERVKNTLVLEDNTRALILFGKGGENLKNLSERLGIGVHNRGNMVILEGDRDRVEVAEKLLRELYELIGRGYSFSQPDMDYAVRILLSDRNVHLKDVFMDTIYISYRKKQIVPKSLAQKLYIDYIREYDMVFGIGPAGTGKTYLAMAAAVASLAEKEVERIILTRPAVEAGERLGFLPGDIASKVDPYLRPLYDALHDMMDFEDARRLLERGVIEVAPLAFMRGRTLNDSFIILDEAQNTTVEQMKMFLTRLGFNSKAVITGDVTQIDLPLARPSGLVETQRILRGIEGIRFVYFTEADVVRHPLVQEVIKAFERAERKKEDAEKEATEHIDTE